MEPMTAYAGDDLLDLALALAYAVERDRFRGSGRARGVAYAFDVTAAPVAHLVPNEPTHNVVVEVPHVVLEAKVGLVRIARTVDLRATATLALEDGSLSLTGLALSSASPRTIDRAIARLIDARVIPSVHEALAAVPMPQLTHVFGRGLAAVLARGAVIDGPVLALGARLDGAGAVAPAGVPSTADLASLHRTQDDGAVVIAMVSSEAVNVLLAELAPPLEQPFERGGGTPGPGAAIRGTLVATTPVLDVADGVATVRTTVSFQSLQGGVRLPLVGWTWLPLPAPRADLVIAHTLSTVGRSGTITLAGVEALRPAIALPRRLRPVERPLRALLDRVVRSFRHRIQAAVVGRTFELFTLPDALPGMGAGVDVTFEPEGLAYVGRSVRAAIRVRIAD